MKFEKFSTGRMYRIVVDVEAEIGIEPEYHKVGQRSWSDDIGSMFDAADSSFFIPLCHLPPCWTIFQFRVFISSSGWRKCPTMSPRPSQAESASLS
jgi:hypothetical protein